MTESALLITAEERTDIDLHDGHRWCDATALDDTRRQILCLSCEVFYAAGPVVLSWNEPLESAALRRERDRNGADLAVVLGPPSQGSGR